MYALTDATQEERAFDFTWGHFQDHPTTQTRNIIACKLYTSARHTKETVEVQLWVNKKRWGCIFIQFFLMLDVYFVIDLDLISGYEIQ